MYSCYFSPNNPIKKFEGEISSIEESSRFAGRDVIIAGDFNSKSPEWGKERLDRRGILVNEMVSRSDMVVANIGHVCTFSKSEAESIIDLTISSSGIAKRIENWRVLRYETLNDHRYIELKIKKKNTQEQDSRGNGSKPM